MFRDSFIYDTGVTYLVPGTSLSVNMRWPQNLKILTPIPGTCTYEYTLLVFTISDGTPDDTRHTPDVPCTTVFIAPPHGAVFQAR